MIKLFLKRDNPPYSQSCSRIPAEQDLSGFMVVLWYRLVIQKKISRHCYQLFTMACRSSFSPNLLRLTAPLCALRTLQRNTTSDVETTSGQPRLATKYQISNIRDKIMAHLRDEYPLALPDVDRVSEHQRAKPDQLYDPIAVIQLSHQGCNVPELLPYAWYRLARHSFADDVDGEFGRLSNEEMRRLIVGRERLRNTAVQFALAGVPAPPLEVSARCTGPEANAETGHGWCKNSAKHYWSTTVLQYAAQTLDPLAALGKLARIPEERLGFCPNCAAWCAHVLNQKRAEIWSSVPQYFGIGLEKAEKEGESAH